MPAGNATQNVIIQKYVLQIETRYVIIPKKRGLIPKISTKSYKFTSSEKRNCYKFQKLEFRHFFGKNKKGCASFGAQPFLNVRKLITE